MPRATINSRLAFAALCWTASVSAQAGPLVDAFVQAQRHDPAYQAAKSERDANLSGAKVASVAYFPQFQAGYQQYDFENSSRQTYSVTQPLINADKYASLKEATPREDMAKVTFEAREQEMVLRLFKEVGALIKSTEGLRLNQTKIDALSKQAQSAQRAYALGQGTVTDLRDAQVRVEQARADSLTLEVQAAASKRAISTITGQSAEIFSVSVPHQSRTLSIKDLDAYVAEGMKANPQLLMAQLSVRMAQINTLRADGALLPVINGVYTNTSNSLASNNYVGLSVALPLQAGSIFQRQAAAAQANRMEEQAKDAAQKLRLETHRYWSLVHAGLKELPIRVAAMASAQLSVDANEKSFKGGVRSQIDVLNSIQTLFQVQLDYINALVALTDNYLNLLLQSGLHSNQALVLVENLLLPEPIR